jgi:hypothetical protein
VSRPTVLVWRGRFAEHGIDGLHDSARFSASRPTVVALAAMTLLSSNNTVPTRIMMMLPSGIFLVSGVKRQIAYVIDLLLRFAPFAVGEVSPIEFSSSLLPMNATSNGIETRWVNAPLVPLIALWASGVLRPSTGPRDQAFDEFAPTANPSPRERI